MGAAEEISAGIPIQIVVILTNWQEKGPENDWITSHTHKIFHFFVFIISDESFNFLTFFQLVSFFLYFFKDD